MEIPWQPWYSMEVTAGFHMNFPWSTMMAMVFHRISMVTMVFHGSYRRFLYDFSMEQDDGHGIPQDFHGVSWYSMEVTIGFHMNFPWSVTLAMVFHIICMAPMVFPLNRPDSPGFMWHACMAVYHQGCNVRETLKLETETLALPADTRPRRNVCQSTPKRCSDCSSKIIFHIHQLLVSDDFCHYH